LPELNCFMYIMYTPIPHTLIVVLIEFFKLLCFFLSWSGDWKDLEFKDYNYGALGQPIPTGYVNPLLEVVFFFYSCSIFSYSFCDKVYNPKLLFGGLASGPREHPKHFHRDGVNKNHLFVIFAIRKPYLENELIHFIDVTDSLRCRQTCL
jgi:hypothetical protein